VLNIFFAEWSYIFVLILAFLGTGYCIAISY